MNSEQFLANSNPEFDPWIVDSYYSELDTGGAKIVRQLPAHPHFILQFILDGTQYMRDLGTGAEVISPAIALFGPQTFRKYDMIVHDHMRVFSIRLQPGAVRILFQCNMEQLINSWMSVPLGEALHRDIAAASCFEDRIAFAEKCIALRTLTARKMDKVAIAAQQLRAAHGNVEIAALALEAGLSTRQFQRNFKQQIGMAPKNYARLCRLAEAIRMHARAPDCSSTEIAFTCGYADQSHLIHDFKALMNDIPSQYQRYQRLPD